MKICLVHEEYPDETNFGGIATYQKHLAENLVKKGHEVTVICRGLKEYSDKVINKVRVIRIYNEETDDIYNNYYKYRELVSDKLLELQNHNEIEIIEVPDWGAETVLFEKYRKIPLVVRLHTPLVIWSEYNKSKLDDSIHKTMLKWEKKMIESADKVVSCTEILKNLVIDKMNLTRTDIDVIPNPSNVDYFISKKDIKKLKSKTILYCGSIEQRKGVILLAEAIPTIIEKLGNVKFLFVGKDTTRNDKNISTVEYIKEIVPKKYHKNLEFKGQLLNSDLVKIYNSSAIGVYPSLFDNFPYVVLESMACSLPFVGSINSGMKEMTNNSNYLYDAKTSEDLANKVIELYNNKEDRESLSKELRERVI
ncbi:MAG: glycosyltransferase family 4 protein, partial [Bacilli bacterium]|nr:glycosyltransferase family 4 protein [Bacilli bacterium]